MKLVFRNSKKMADSMSWSDREIQHSIFKITEHGLLSLLNKLNFLNFKKMSLGPSYKPLKLRKLTLLELHEIWYEGTFGDPVHVYQVCLSKSFTGKKVSLYPKIE